jgi:hypothetical protein
MGSRYSEEQEGFGVDRNANCNLPIPGCRGGGLGEGHFFGMVSFNPWIEFAPSFSPP